MTHAVAVAGIEEQHLIGFGHGLIATQMTHEHAAIREDEVGERGAFLSAQLAAAPVAARIANGDAARLQQ